VVQGLARANAWIVAHILVILGIEAQAMGNVIALANCTLGVEAACSGIRSLQAGLMVALLTGELYRLSRQRRIQVVLLAFGLALVGNFSRALSLALIASTYGIKTMEGWHDDLGDSILVFTSLTTWLVCAFLHHREPQQEPSPAQPSTLGNVSPEEGLAQRLALGILLATIFGITATQAWYGWRELGVRQNPSWVAMLPNSGNFKEVAIPEVSQKILSYDVGRQVEWQDDKDWSWTVYWFRYHPKPIVEYIFKVHNPDACLPAAGFQKVAEKDPFTANVRGVQLQVYPKEFSWKGIPVYVFWVVYANRANFPMEKAFGTLDTSPGGRARLYLSDIWHGRRSSTSETETLETIISGPENYEAVRAGYMANLQKIIVPDVDVPEAATTASSP
jgi:exosortase/archaeosortase family protein